MFMDSWHRQETPAHPDIYAHCSSPHTHTHLYVRIYIYMQYELYSDMQLAISDSILEKNGWVPR